LVATELRKVCREHGLCVVDSFHDVAPTFFPPGRLRRGRRIDHLLTSVDFATGNTTACRTLSRLGHRLQLAHTVRNWDHHPMATFFHYDDMAFVRKNKLDGRPPWRREALCDGLMFGTRRQEFFNALDRELQSQETAFDASFSTDPTADGYHSVFIDSCKRAAEGIFYTAERDSSAYPVLMRGLAPQPCAARLPPSDGDVAALGASTCTDEHAQNVEDAKQQRMDVLERRHGLKVRLAEFPSDDPEVQQTWDELWLVQWELRRISRDARHLQAHLSVLRRAHAVQNINDAYRRRDTRSAYSWAMGMGGTRPRRKLQRFDSITLLRATTNEWMDKCKLPAHRGGFGGLVVDYHAEAERILGCDHATEDVDYRVVPTADHVHMAQVFLERMSKVVMKLKPFKSIVPHSIPNELWRMLVRGTWVNKLVQKYGLGHVGRLVPPGRLQRVLVNYFAKIFATRMTPLHWHVAPSFAVGKANGKAGLDGQRLVVAMCPIGRTSYELIINGPIFKRADGRSLDAASFEQDPIAIAKADDWQYGCVPGRRREAAFLVQSAHAWEVKHFGLFMVNSFYDSANAFFSLDQDAICEAARPPFVATDDEHYLVRQRVKLAVAVVGARDEQPVFMLVRTGALPGDHAGPRLFNRTIAEPGSRIGRQLRIGARHPEWLKMQCCLWDEPVPTVLTGFVDDIAVKVVAESEQLLVSEKQRTDGVVKDGLLAIGLTQNAEKEQNVVIVPRRDAAVRLRKCLPHVAPFARYLGPQFSESLTVRDELPLRLANMKRNWATLAPFLTSTAVRSFRRAVCQACIRGAALSGLEAFVGSKGPLAAAELLALQQYEVKALRAMARGDATAKRVEVDDDGEVHKSFAAISSAEVLRSWRFVPLHVELRVRRLLMFQGLLRNRDHNDIALCALLGGLAGRPPPLGADGTVIRNRAHPWLRQLELDLLALEDVEELSEPLRLSLTDTGCLSVRRLIVDFAPELLAADTHELRNPWLSVSIPPPVLVPPWLTSTTRMRT